MQEHRSDKPSGFSLAAVEQQKLVDARFQSSAALWKQIYELDGLDPTIYQLRRAAVLALVEKLGLPPRSPVLEIGCGAGLTTVTLAQRGYAVQAIDTVDVMISLTRQLAVEAGVAQRVVTSMGDAHDLAFPNNLFSLAIGMGVAPWLHALDKAIRELARVLKPEGFLILTTDNRWCLNHALDPIFFPPLRPARRKVRDLLERFGLWRLPKAPRLHRYSIKEFDAHLATAGLEKVEGMTLGFGPFTFLNFKLLTEALGVTLHHKLQRLADRRFPVIRSAGVEYVVLAKRSGSH